MKLMRYGEVGSEKPGLMDGDVLRDLSGHVDDITGAVLGDDALARLNGIDPASLPEVTGNPALTLCGRVFEIHVHRAEFQGSRG